MASVEEKKNIRKSIIYIILTIVLLVLLVVYWLPLTAKIAGFLGNIKSSSQPIEKVDTTPPAPPKIELLPEATNKLSLVIVGSTEAGATVKLFINDSVEEVVADKSGDFNFTFGLNKGENIVSALTRDAAGNESIPTEEYKILYDNEKPPLDILSPEDGKNFYGSMERQTVIEGKTEEDAEVTVNDRVVVVESDGTFAYATSLTEGDNNFTIKATDKAGNQSEKGITLRFWK